MADKPKGTEELDPNSQEYMDAMAKKGASAVGETPEVEETEETTEETLLAGKYKTEDDLSKGVLELIKKEHGSLEDYYKKLEADLGKPAKSEETPKPETDEDILNKGKEVDEEGNPIEPKEDAKTVDFDKYTNELTNNGELSDESYKELTAQGYPKEMVDAYIAGITAQAETNTAKVYEMAGGKDSYDAIVDWAVDNLNDQEKETFNALVAQSEGSARMAVEALKSRYEKAEGVPPTNLLKGDTTLKAKNTDVFNSIPEMTKAMSDPRYEKDEAYRAKVQEKLSRSDII